MVHKFIHFPCFTLFSRNAWILWVCKNLCKWNVTTISTKNLAFIVTMKITTKNVHMLNLWRVSCHVASDIWICASNVTAAVVFVWSIRVLGMHLIACTTFVDRTGSEQICLFIYFYSVNRGPLDPELWPGEIVRVGSGSSMRVGSFWLLSQQI
jgi:hypothetical protein